MVRIITDSASDFEPLELQLLNVESVPLSVTFGNITYKENVNLTKRMFYNLLKTHNMPPTTSQPSPECFEEIFRNAENQGDEVVAILISSKISGTYQCGKYASSHFKNIHIIDSKTASAGQRILVEEAVRMRNSGHSSEEIVNHLEILKEKIRLFAVIDSGDSVKRSGRLSESEKINNISNIKPILTLDKGAPKLIHKAIGTQRGINYIIKQLQNHKPDTNYPFHIMYAHNHHIAVKFKEQLIECGYHMTDHCLVNIGAAIGSHIGVNSCGIAYVEK